jgi:hypothetical protein
MSSNAPAYTVKIGSGIGLNAAMVDATALNGQPVDSRGFSHAVGLLTLGDLSAVASATLTVKMQESASGTGSWADITGATTGAIDVSSATVNDRATWAIPVNLLNSNRLRYLRLVATPAQAANCGTWGGLIVLSNGGETVSTFTAASPTSPDPGTFTRITQV